MYIVEIGNIHKSRRVAEVTSCELFDRLREIFSSYCAEHSEEFLARIKDDLRIWRHYARVTLGLVDESGVFRCRFCSGLLQDWWRECDEKVVELWVEEADDLLWFLLPEPTEGGDLQ